MKTQKGEKKINFNLTKNIDNKRTQIIFTNSINEHTVNTNRLCIFVNCVVECLIFVRNFLLNKFVRKI